MTEKPIPQVLYGCHFCGDEYSHPADELFWSEKYKAWVCDSCWDDQDKHWDHDNGSCCKYGISLEEELGNRKYIGISKNVNEIPIDIPILILLVDGSIHTAIKRQSTVAYSDRTESSFYFDIVGTMDIELQEPCFISCEEVVGFANIPKIKVIE